MSKEMRAKSLIYIALTIITAKLIILEGLIKVKLINRRYSMVNNKKML